jgi:hypothetical protein
MVIHEDDKGGDEVRKRSWGWRLAAVVAGVALAARAASARTLSSSPSRS